MWGWYVLISDLFISPYFNGILCKEFVSLITIAALQSAESNAKGKAKSEQIGERGVFLGGQDIINAMHELGFDDYIKEMETIRDAYKENARQKAQKRKYDEADEMLQKQLLGV